jgi:hypothetical protein
LNCVLHRNVNLYTNNRTSDSSSCNSVIERNLRVPGEDNKTNLKNANLINRVSIYNS